MLRRPCLATLCIALSAFAFATDVSKPTGSPGPSPEVQNLEAFSRLYGYVRFFHPSDEAATIGWERFAILGAIRIREVPPTGDLLKVMNRLFMPIAPAVQIYRTGDPPEPFDAPENASELTPIAWQHLGVRLPGIPTEFLSKRTNREVRFSQEISFGTITQVVDAEPYRGKAVRLVAAIRAQVDGPGNQGQMWLRVDREDRNMGFFENMDDRPVTGDQWRDYEIIGDIAEDADRMLFGVFLLGRGRVMVDDVRIFVGDGDGEWTPVEIPNPGFEEGEIGKPPPDWSARTPGYLFEVSSESPHEGNRSVSISVEPDEVVTKDLFEARPDAGEILEVELGAGLSARIPLVVLADGSSTLPTPNQHALIAMRHELESVNLRSLSEYSECTRVAGVVISWNVLHHFYPFFDVVDADWEAELTRALTAALADESGESYFGVLEKMAVALNDGRARVYHPRYAPYGYLPIAVDWAEDQIVVTVSAVDELRPGDVITRIDGVDAREALGEWEGRTSGSPQWKRAWSLGLFGAGQIGESVSLTVSRGETSFDAEITRGEWKRRPSESRPNEIEEFEEGIFYVDLTRAATSEVERRMSEITTARGVIFDLRGKLNVAHRIFGHLLSEPDTSTAWMQVSEIIRPDQAGPVGWRDRGWPAQPLEPLIEGKVAFISHGGTIGAAESLVELVNVHDLAEIVGQPTAGAGGDFNRMVLPGNFDFRWTGVRVLGRDGSNRHLVGVLPTVPADRTIQGIRSGRDELLDRAIEIVSAGDAAIGAADRGH